MLNNIKLRSAGPRYGPRWLLAAMHIITTMMRQFLHRHYNKTPFEEPRGQNKVFRVRRLTIAGPPLVSCSLCSRGGLEYRLGTIIFAALSCLTCDAS